MEINKIREKIHSISNRYKYGIVVLIIGLCLMLIPGNQSRGNVIDTTVPSANSQETLTDDSLAQILQTVEGAGKVKVLLSIGAGEQTIYQADTEMTISGENQDEALKTVIISDSQKNEQGLIKQVNPAVYKGAIVVCQGADSPAVRLAVTQAVSKITGLGSDSICVLKMQ